MSLFQTINELDKAQLTSIVISLGIKKDIAEASTVNTLKQKIKHGLIKYYQRHREITYEESYQLIGLWRDCIKEVIKKKHVKADNEPLKQEVLNELARLISRDTLNDGERIEVLVREILLLLWKETSERDQRRFLSAVREDLDSHKAKFTEEEIKQNLQTLLLGSIGSATPLIVPAISAILLQRLTQGFMAWFAITILGQGAAQVAVLGALTGPVGWTISGGLLGVGAVTSAIKYKRERDKLRFVQAILSTYSYRYQNRIRNRGKR